MTYHIRAIVNASHWGLFLHVRKISSKLTLRGFSKECFIIALDFVFYEFRVWGAVQVSSALD